MWHKEYRDYKYDQPLKKSRTETGKGIIGVEMNEPNGWGDSFHQYKKPKRGFLGSLFMILFGPKKGK